MKLFAQKSLFKAKKTFKLLNSFKIKILHAIYPFVMCNFMRKHTFFGKVLISHPLSTKTIHVGAVVCSIPFKVPL